MAMKKLSKIRLGQLADMVDMVGFEGVLRGLEDISLDSADYVDALGFTDPGLSGHYRKLANRFAGYAGTVKKLRGRL